jgi:hypothetical protein
MLSNIMVELFIDCLTRRNELLMNNPVNKKKKKDKNGPNVALDLSSSLWLR